MVKALAGLKRRNSELKNVTNTLTKAKLLNLTAKFTGRT